MNGVFTIGIDHRFADELAQGVLADTVTAVEAAPAGRDGERAWGGSACVCGPCN